MKEQALTLSLMLYGGSLWSNKMCSHLAFRSEFMPKSRIQKVSNKLPATEKYVLLTVKNMSGDILLSPYCQQIP